MSCLAQCLHSVAYALRVYAPDGVASSRMGYHPGFLAKKSLSHTYITCFKSTFSLYKQLMAIIMIKYLIGYYLIKHTLLNVFLFNII